MTLLRGIALRLPPVRRLHDSRETLRDERDALAGAHDKLRVDRDTLAMRLAESESRPIPPPHSPFYHYHAAFDPQEVIRRHAAPDLHEHSAYFTNFLGVRIDPRFFPGFLKGREGQIEGVPIPANWHADIAEWGAALRSVDLARGKFTVIELGCGWGCWMNNTGVAARRAGLDVHMIGVEGDAAHVAFAREACAINGFAPHQVSLHRGIAAPAGGFALFPRQEQGGEHWGLEPIFGATEEQRHDGINSGRYDELPMIALDDVAEPHDRIDLLHIDIQGGEADLIAGCLPICSDKVAYILVGTHSRQIEGRIIDTLLTAGWTLEIERPAIYALNDNGPLLIVDGVQGWRNPSLDFADRG